MNKIQSSLETIRNDIELFYQEEKHHFLGLNGISLDENTIEVQWIFCEYGVQNSESVFYVEAKYEDTIPSLVDILPSAIISQRELVDMFGIKVEDTSQGLYLDEDSLATPLKGCAL